MSKRINIEPTSDLYNAIVMDIADNEGIETEQVTSEQVESFVTGVLWNAVESR